MNNYQAIHLVMYHAKLFNNPEDSDLTIIKSDKSIIRAHKLILKNGSSVLKRMIESPMKESKSSTISFPKHQPQTVDRAIAFIYGIDIPDDLTDKDWTDLLLFSDYLDIVIPSLGTKYPKTLNLSEVLALANKFPSNDLSEVIIGISPKGIHQRLRVLDWPVFLKFVKKSSRKDSYWADLLHISADYINTNEKKKLKIYDKMFQVLESLKIVRGQRTCLSDIEKMPLFNRSDTMFPYILEIFRCLTHNPY